MPLNKKTVKNIAGDKVYDNCNKIWVVIGFEIKHQGEVKYYVTNGIVQKTYYESQISQYPKNINENPDEKIACLMNQPI